MEKQCEKKHPNHDEDEKYNNELGLGAFFPEATHVTTNKILRNKILPRLPHPQRKLLTRNLQLQTCGCLRKFLLNYQQKVSYLDI